MKIEIEQDIPEGTPIVEACCIEARNLGIRDGANTAHWVAQDTFGGRCTRDHKQKARAVLESIESCDHMHMDVTLPNLSGEYADGMTPTQLLETVKQYQDVGRGMHEAEVDEALDDICQAYEDGVVEGYEWQLATLAKSTLE
jgi:hypothetical protein